MLRGQIGGQGLQGPRPHERKIQPVHILVPSLEAAGAPVVGVSPPAKRQTNTLSRVIHRVVHNLCTSPGVIGDMCVRFDRRAAQNVTYDGRVASTAVLRARRSPVPRMSASHGARCDISTLTAAPHWSLE
ncbi:hypothetical protein GCM10023195_81100 [Actinoallomurus liliacearum]|uniref:Uncharacterized protein n=1 Tax=Actinoallomurus liliacearum TaxID=1080073 RepID=A0ABP8TWI5_9ACTN